MGMAQVYRTDGELLRAFAGGNEDASFEELVRRHGGLVRRVARRVCRRDDDAEDVVQQVFLTLAKRSAELGGRVSLAGWIYNTTLHVSMRQRRNAALREKHEREAGAQKGRAAAGTNVAAAD